MSPHHALQTADIVRLIFETFDNDADRRFCARAASVCRAFYDPASLVAWAKLTSFSPLWATLTDSSYSCLNTRLTEVKRVYIAEILQKESYRNSATWSAFLRCAARVRIVEYYQVKILDAEAELIRTLFVFNHDATFLPSLRQLTWTLEETTCSVLPFICSLTLNSIHLVYFSGSAGAMSSNMASLIAAVSPHIRTLSVNANRVVPVPSILAMVSHMKEAESISATTDRLDVASSPTLIGSLATLPGLRHLNVIVRDLEAFDSVISLPTLSRLQCRGFPEDLLRLLDALDAPHLRDVDFRFVDGWLAQCTRCVQKLSTKFLSLRSLGLQTEIDYLRLGYRFFRDEMSLPDFLESCPISALQQLEKFTVIMDDPRLSSFSNEHFSSLAQILPNVRHLSLSLTQRGALHLATILQAAAVMCPRLEFLKIDGVLMDPLEWARTPLAPNGRNHPLRELHWRGLPLHVVEPASVAVYLDALFPSLQVVRGERESEVMECLRSLQRSRRRESV